MTDDTPSTLYTPYRGPKWQIGKLSIGFHSHEDIVDLAASFAHTDSFLDAVGFILKRVDHVFGLRQPCIEASDTFLDPPPSAEQVSIITEKLTAVCLAWQIARDSNTAVAAFKMEALEDLRTEIRRANRDAIDAARNGTELQKFVAAFKSRKGLTDAFYRLNRELSIHRAKHDLASRARRKRKRKHSGHGSAPSEEQNSLNRLTANANSGQHVSENWLEPRCVRDLARETGCSRTTINAEVKNGTIPGGARRENGNPRGDVILQQIGLDYLKRKGGRANDDRR